MTEGFGIKEPAVANERDNEEGTSTEHKPSVPNGCASLGVDCMRLRREMCLQFAHRNSTLTAGT